LGVVGESPGNETVGGGECGPAIGGVRIGVEEQIAGIGLEAGRVVRLAIEADGCDGAIGVGDAIGGEEDRGASDGGIG